MLTLKQLGERGLMRSLRPYMSPPSRELIVGAPDDDAAVWRSPAGPTVATIDTLVEGVDFRLDWPAFDFRVLGRRLVSINLSDLAAMGAQPPIHALVSLCLRSEVRAPSVARLYRGIAEQARRYHCTVAGGDLSATNGPLVLTAALFGSIPLKAAALRRSGARAGWQLATTGRLGNAAAGLALLEAGRRPGTPAERRWVRAQLDPQPRLEAARLLRDGGIRVAGDISDGLFREVERITEASGVGAVLEIASLPIDPALERAYPRRAWRLALEESEDFELVCAAPAERVAALAPQLRRATGLTLTSIGRLGPGAGVRLRDAAGRTVQLSGRGYEHFR